MTDELSGRALGRYQVLERLGRGGMAEVYRAYQPSLDRFVAIKVIYPHLATDPGLRERFGREARAVAALHHPNIVQVHDFDMQGDMAFMAMEFVSGPTLKAALSAIGQRGRQLPLPVVGQVVGQLADALGYAHDQSVVHRDVKPANVLLRRRDLRRDASEGAGPLPPLSDADLEDLLLNLGPASVVLTDFGVARVISDSAEQTAAGTILGSPAYMSPEQGRGERAGPASDIYSLGVVLYELLAGRVPFDADTPFAIVIKHIQTPLPPPRVYRPDLPEALERVLLKSLAKDPGDRFLDAAAFGSAVRAACGVPDRSTLRLVDAPASAALLDPAGATRVIEELQATRPPAPAPAPPPTAAPPTPASATATVPPQPRRSGVMRRVLGIVIGLLVLGGIVLVAFVAGGALVFTGLGQVGALVVPTEYQAEATAAAARGEPFPFSEQSPPPAGTALPEAVADALEQAREACDAPGCPDGRASEAVSILDEAIAASPQSAPLFAARAQAYLWWDPSGYAEQVSADVAAALERDPNSAAAYLARGDLAAIQDDSTAALESYARAIELAPALVAPYVARASMLANAPDYYEQPSPSRDQVLSDASAALALDPENVYALVLRGNAYSSSNQPDAAFADYSAALNLEPENLNALTGRANVSRYARQDLQAALADYDAAIEAYPEHVDSRRSRITLLAEQGEYEAVREDADQIVKLQPAAPESYTLRGFLALATGALNAAADDFDQAIAIAGEGDLAARYGRGRVLLERNAAAKAIPDLEAAAADLEQLNVDWYSFFQGHRAVFFDLARAYAETGRRAEALVAVDQAIETDSGWHRPYLLRGRLRAANGDAVGAREDLRRALELVGEAPERAEVEAELRRLP